MPKTSGTRARRNHANVRKLTALPLNRSGTPPLPKNRKWHSLTKAWWDEIWDSPMAGEYEDSDVNELYLLAALVDEFWTEPTTSLAAEIRLQRQCFGLTPIDRRRLQWEIERGENAEESTAKRRKVKAYKGSDPRALLS
jgi:hypothetical protein